MDFAKKLNAISLRKNGLSYREIRKSIFSNRKNKLYEGTCVIKIHSRDLMSKILGWMDGLKNTFLINVTANHYA